MFSRDDFFGVPGRTWLTHLLCWTGGGVLLAVFIWTYTGSFVAPLIRSVSMLGTYGFMAPAVFRWAGRLGAPSRPWTGGRALLDVGVVFTLFVCVHAALHSTLKVAWNVTDLPLREAFTNYLYRAWLIELIVFSGIFITAQTSRYKRWLREKELEATELRRQLVEARLAALHAQLQPHFLFNTLHTIGVLTRRDPEAANRVIALVGDLLRRTLDSSDEQEVALKEELEALAPYLEIQRTRFRDRLDVHLDVDPDTLHCRVPNLILQPLVENAVRHGIEARSGEGHISIRTQSEDGHLILEVVDNGVGLGGRNGVRPREGLGLGNTRERLASLYGDDQELVLEDLETGGVRAMVRIPVLPARGIAT
ncbi:MAG: hypothetical protein CMJ18_23060 [Phycisphaeraceae bacterium]|nr:hypothetical protein [Phycisphaeraceae bacterium]